MVVKEGDSRCDWSVKKILDPSYELLCLKKGLKKVYEKMIEKNKFIGEKIN